MSHDVNFEIFYQNRPSKVRQTLKTRLGKTFLCSILNLELFFFQKSGLVACIGSCSYPKKAFCVSPPFSNNLQQKINLQQNKSTCSKTTRSKKQFSAKLLNLQHRTNLQPNKSSCSQFTNNKCGNISVCFGLKLCSRQTYRNKTGYYLSLSFGKG